MSARMSDDDPSGSEAEGSRAPMSVSADVAEMSEECDVDNFDREWASGADPESLFMGFCDPGGVDLLLAGAGGAPVAQVPERAVPPASTGPDADARGADAGGPTVAMEDGKDQWDIATSGSSDDEGAGGAVAATGDLGFAKAEAEPGIAAALLAPTSAPPPGAASPPAPQPCRSGPFAEPAFDSRLDPLPMPEGTPQDILWWFRPVWNFVSNLRQQLPQPPSSVFATELLCAGAGTDMEAMKLLGIDFRVSGAADRKPASRRFLQHHSKYNGNRLDHVFSENSDMAARCGECAIHKRKNECPSCSVSPGPVHYAAAGLPCRPFTSFRQRTGSTDRTKSTPEHPDLQTIFVEYFEYLDAAKPETIFVEEVEEFNSPIPGTGLTYLKKFAGMCTQRGYAIRAFTLDHGMFVALPRKRLFLTGFSRAAGHSTAANWFFKQLQAFLSQMSDWSPVPVWQDGPGGSGVIDVDDPAEVLMRGRAMEANAERQRKIETRSKKMPKWKDQSIRIRAAHQVPKDAAPWTSGARLHGVPRCARVDDIIDLRYVVRRAKLPQLSRTALSKDLFCDFSQMPQRRPVKTGLMTLTGSSTIYSFEKDCALTGFSCLRLMGWSKDRLGLHSFCSTDYQSLAGGSYSLPICALCVGILHANPHGSWHRR